MSWRIPAIFALLVIAGAALAQTSGGQSNAFQGFTGDSNQPVSIEADSLEIRDKDQHAVFIGNVVVKQGDSVMRCRELKVHYEGSIRDVRKRGEKGEDGEPARSSPARAGSKDPSQRIRRLEALGGVIVTNKDQKATGDRGDFDMRTNVATLVGNVVISQGPNVMRADKLVIDMKTGFSRMEAGTKDGKSRVQGLFLPSSIEKQKSPQK